MVYAKRKVKTLFKNMVLIKTDKLEYKGAIQLPDSVKSVFETVDEGIVLKIADGVTQVSPGDLVAYSKHTAPKLSERFGEGLVICYEADINMVIEKVEEEEKFEMEDKK